jgi:N-acetylneuraminic acid mutarotase
MLIFGGKTVKRGTLFLDDLYELNLELGTWTRINTVGGPTGRMCAASLYRDGIFCVLMGGSYCYLNDCHELDTATGEWRRLTNVGTTPCTRPTAVLHDNKVTIFGGCDGDSNYLNATLELDLEPPSLKELCRQWLRRSYVNGQFDPTISKTLNKYLRTSH